MVLSPKTSISLIGSKTEETSRLSWRRHQCDADFSKTMGEILPCQSCHGRAETRTERRESLLLGCLQDFLRGRILQQVCKRCPPGCLFHNGEKMGRHREIHPDHITKSYHQQRPSERRRSKPKFQAFEGKRRGDTQSS